MPRTIWTGSISFGLVNVPVRMYSAVREHTLHFHYVHRKDNAPIGYQKICKEEHRAVPAKEIARAFEVEKGNYVFMDEEDFQAVQPESARTMELLDFVPYEEIDPIYFRSTYFLGPQEGAERVYALLVRAMEESGLAALGKFVMHGREHLGCVRVRERTLTLEQMYFADEVQPMEDVAPRDAKVGARELTMAKSLIERFKSHWDPTRYRDTYRDALCEIIRRKQEGEEIHAAPSEAPAVTEDLFAALKESLRQAGGGRRAPDGRRAANDQGGRRAANDQGGRRAANGHASKRAASEELQGLTKGELYDRAKEAAIPGRATMSREELIAALRKAA